jgi:sugar transferase EpsL
MQDVAGRAGVLCFAPVAIRGDTASFIKRVIDLTGAAAGLVVLSPVLVGTALAVAVMHGRPVLFRQTRPGLHGKPFTIRKFRTMRSPRPSEVAYLTDAQRVTRLGAFLRETSLDELPELWNVLAGSMSLVGPRPLLMEYLDKYSPDEMRRHDVLPGITGWAAVSGRHKLTFRERLKLDTWYVDHWSLGLDLKILGMTLYQVFRRIDVSTTQESKELGFPLAFPGQPDGDGAQRRGSASADQVASPIATERPRE